MDDRARRIETAQNLLVSRRNYRRARDRALAKLAGIYREQYVELLEQEREKDVKEGKAWLDISGSTYLDNLMDGNALDTKPVEASKDTN